MFSLVVSVPYNTQTQLHDVQGVTDDLETVRDTTLQCDVYVGQRVVAATVLRWPNVLRQCPGGRVQWPGLVERCIPLPQTWVEVKRNCPPDTIRDGYADHAEYRTLQNINRLVQNHNKDRKDLLVFYVLASPCDKRCTSQNSQWSILESIKFIKKWNSYAVVFTDIFQPRNGAQIPDEEQRGALERLGKSVGLANIFRCYQQEGIMQCINCSTKSGEVDCRCYKKKEQPQVRWTEAPLSLT